MTTIEVLNPVAKAVAVHVAPAQRLHVLDGARIGLYWNYKTGGDVFLRRLAELVEQRFPGAIVRYYAGDVGLLAKHATDRLADRIAMECDVVVGSTADCGGCTAWLVRDLITFEQRGVPTVCVTARSFVRDAERSAATFGLPMLPMAVIPTPTGNQAHDAVRAMCDDAFAVISRGLTSETSDVVSDGLLGHVTLLEDEVLTFEGSDTLDAVRQMNERFVEYAWSDGLPLLPPTVEAVESMAAGTTRPLDELVAILEPGFGRVTVRIIAANAVMAGCRPEHLPVLITAIECMADPKMNVRGKQMSTGPDAPVVIVNGPIAARLKLNHGRCALGPGSPSAANVVIGRALRLCLMNGGHAYPGVTDLDTIGTPAKFGMVLAENVAASPWEPYHAERGHAPDVDTVTVHWVEGISELEDLHSTDPDTLLRPWATALTNAANLSTGAWLCGRRADPRTGDEDPEHHLLLIAPDHASVFSAAGWTKSRLREELHQIGQMSFELMLIPKEPNLIRVTHPELDFVWDEPTTLLPVLESADCYELVVVGEGNGRSMLLYGCGSPITRPIQGIPTHVTTVEQRLSNEPSSDAHRGDLAGTVVAKAR